MSNTEGSEDSKSNPSSKGDPLSQPAPNGSLNQLSYFGLMALVISLIGWILLNNGYRAFRVDHMTQVPMLMYLLDDSLYPNDWFFDGTGHYAIRQVFLQLEVFLYGILNSIPLVLFSQHLVYLGLLSCAFWGIGRKFGLDVTFLFIWTAMMTWGNKFADLGGTYCIEPDTIPRMYSYASFFIALAFCLHNKPLVGGLFLGALGLFQGAPSAQGLLILIPWLLYQRGLKKGGISAGLLFAGFLMTYWPQFMVIGDVLSTQAETLTPDQRVHLLAYIRHPHHMFPHLYKVEHYICVTGIVIFGWFLYSGGRIESRFKPLRDLCIVFVGYFLFFNFFIYVIPINKIIFFQPMRMFAVFRVFLYFFIAVYVWNQLRNGDRMAFFRAASFLWAFAKAESVWQLPFILMVIEGVVLLVQRYRQDEDRRFEVEQTVAILGAWLFYGNSRTVFLAITAIWLLVTYREGFVAFVRQKAGQFAQFKGLPFVGVGASFGFIAFLLLTPFTAWQEKMPSQWNSLEIAHYKVAMKYQVYPFPDQEYERAAYWAKNNTPEDAMFLIPAGRTGESFHIWSERSAFFLFKTLPYKQAEWINYIQRYFAVRGVLDFQESINPDSLYHLDYQRIWNDAGGLGTDADYRKMPADTFYQLCEKYDIDYVLTRSINLIGDPRFEEVAGPFIETGDRIDPEVLLGEMLYMYRVKK